MKKKPEAAEAPLAEEIEAGQTPAPAAEEAPVSAKAAEKIAPSKSDKNKKKYDKNKKPGFFKRNWLKIRDAFRELKKVTWPTFGKTLRQTGVVLVVVLFFIVIIGAANAGFTALYNLLPGMEGTALLKLLPGVVG